MPCLPTSAHRTEQRAAISSLSTQAKNQGALRSQTCHNHRRNQHSKTMAADTRPPSPAPSLTSTISNCLSPPHHVARNLKVDDGTQRPTLYTHPPEIEQFKKDMEPYNKPYNKHALPLTSPKEWNESSVTYYQDRPKYSSTEAAGEALSRMLSQAPQNEIRSLRGEVSAALFEGKLDPRIAQYLRLESYTDMVSMCKRYIGLFLDADKQHGAPLLPLASPPATPSPEESNQRGPLTPSLPTSSTRSSQRRTRPPQRYPRSSHPQTRPLTKRADLLGIQKKQSKALTRRKGFSHALGKIKRYKKDIRV
jgi:hypothetical protein